MPFRRRGLRVEDGAAGGERLLCVVVVTQGQVEFLAYPILDDVASGDVRGGIKIKQYVRVRYLRQAVYASHACQVVVQGRGRGRQFQKLVPVPMAEEDGSPVVRFGHGEVATGYLEIDHGVFRCCLHRPVFSSGLVVAV